LKLIDQLDGDGRTRRRMLEGALLEAGGGHDGPEIITESEGFLGITYQVFIYFIIIVHIMVHGDGIDTRLNVKLDPLGASLPDDEYFGVVGFGARRAELLGRLENGYPEGSLSLSDVGDLNRQGREWGGHGSKSQQDKEYQIEHGGEFSLENASPEQLFRVGV